MFMQVTYRMYELKMFPSWSVPSYAGPDINSISEGVDQVTIP